MATELGTKEYRDRPGLVPGTAAWPCGAGPPESAWVLGAARPGGEPRLPRI